MPWAPKDVETHIKGLSKKQKKKWVNIANAVLGSCQEDGGKNCDAKAIRIANSKFELFNPVMSIAEANKMKKIFNDKNNGLKKFQYRKDTPQDPIDGHVHTAAYDENGDGGTDEAGTLPHVHQVWNFRVQPHYYFNPETGESYTSQHPGSLAFNEKMMEGMDADQKAIMKKCMDSGGDADECRKKAMKVKSMAELLEIPEMEIFRPGTHNGDEFSDKDLEEIANNFKKLKDEVRPKLKITHEENQKTLAGLASYGDIVDVFVKKVEDGTKRLFAKIINVPKQVIDFIKERRFPERSIELYPKFKLGTQSESPIYRNVLKAIALLGQEMPAVSGMEPIKLSEDIENQETICFGEVCFVCEEEAKDHLLVKAMSLEADMKIFQGQLSKGGD